MEEYLKNIKYLIMGIGGASFALLVIFAAYDIRYKNIYPFKCYSFAHYDLSRSNSGGFDLFLTQDIRLQNEKGGYLLLNGDVATNNVKTYLSRTIILGKGEKIDDDTYRYQIIETKISASDNTPTREFNQLLTEFTSNPAVLQLDVIKLHDNTFLIGGPVSYLFTCKRY